MAPKESRASKIVEFEDGKFWFHKKSNVITVGITLDALDSLGDIEKVSLPSEGDDFSKDDVIVEVDGSDHKLKVVTPASGFVTEVNEALADDPSILNEDPIDEGWLVKIELQDATELTEYL